MGSSPPHNKKLAYMHTLTEGLHARMSLLDVHFLFVGVELKDPKAAKPAGFVEEEGSPYTVEQLQFLLGLALVLGFVTMLLIDQCGGGHSHNHSTGEERKRERD